MRIIMENPWIFISILIFLALLLVFCLIRAIKGPTISDRVVAVNMIGTIVMVIIAMLALYMKESYLLDICLIYAMISFLAVVVLTKVYSGVYLEKIAKARKQQAEAAQAQKVISAKQEKAVHPEKAKAEEQEAAAKVVRAERAETEGQEAAAKAVRPEKAKVEGQKVVANGKQKKRKKRTQAKTMSGKQEEGSDKSC